MKCGDYVRYKFGHRDVTGLVIDVKNPDAFTYEDLIEFSFELLELDGRRFWYDVHTHGPQPEILNSK